jgi:hypothetical protein
MCMLQFYFYTAFYYLTLKIEAIGSSNTSGYLPASRCYDPDDRVLHSHRCENLRSNKMAVFEILRFLRPELQDLEHVVRLRGDWLAASQSRGCTQMENSSTRGLTWRRHRFQLLVR